MDFVTLGETLHYAHRRPSGTGPTIAFANSLGTDFRTWDAVVDRLPAEIGALTYDKRGHGLSGAPSSRLDDHVGDLAGLLDHVGAETTVVCGLSVGGVIAQGFARAHPDRLAALILTCTGAKIGDTAVWQPRIDAVRDGGIEAIADQVMERWFPANWRRDEPAVAAGMRAMLTRQPAAGYLAICEMLRDTDLRDAAPGIAVPTLCVAGSEDKATPPELVRTTAALIPGSRVVELDGCGHIPCVQAPDRFADAIIGFLGEHSLG